MLRFLGIAVAIILGVVLGGFTAKLFNKGRATLNPRIFTIVGVLGSGIGAYFAGRFGGGGIKTTALQIAAGVVCAVILLLFLLLARGKKEPLDGDDF